MDNNKSLDTVSILSHYFTDLLPTKIVLFTRLGALYRYWNSKINLVSRKDIEHLYLHHILHGLAIAKLVHFTAGTKILDFGTGGGLPGIPLAIRFPKVFFHLVDTRKKKIKVVETIVSTLNLKNVKISCTRGEILLDKYDFIVGRGVANLNLFYGWVKNKIALVQKNRLPNGILYLKGKPTESLPLSIDLYPLSGFFKESFFQEKYLVHAYNIHSKHN